MRQFIVRCKSGQRYEAVTAEQLRKLAASGLIGAEDEICQIGTNRWIPCSKVKGLFEERPPQTQPVDSADAESDDAASEIPSELKVSFRGKITARFKCPACQNRMDADEQDIGTSSNCTRCGITLIIPGLIQLETHQQQLAQEQQEAAERSLAENLEEEEDEYVEEASQEAALEDDSDPTNKTAERWGAAIGGMLLGIGILYVCGWSLILGSVVLPNDLDEAGARFVDHMAPGLSEKESDEGVTIATQGIAFTYAAHFIKMLEDGYAVNRFMAVVAINSKPWGVVNTFRFFHSPTIQYAGLGLGIIIFFSGIGYAIGSDDDDD